MTRSSSAPIRSCSRKLLGLGHQVNDEVSLARLVRRDERRRGRTATASARRRPSSPSPKTGQRKKRCLIRRRRRGAAPTAFLRARGTPHKLDDEVALEDAPKPGNRSPGTPSHPQGRTSRRTFPRRDRATAKRTGRRRCCRLAMCQRLLRTGDDPGTSRRRTRHRWPGRGRPTTRGVSCRLLGCVSKWLKVENQESRGYGWPGPSLQTLQRRSGRASRAWGTMQWSSRFAQGFHQPPGRSSEQGRRRNQ